MCHELLEFLEALYRACSPERATLVFARFLERSGFDTFACGDYDTMNLGQSHSFAKSWPRDYADFYYGKAALTPDPIRKTVPSAIRPVVWSDLLASQRTAPQMRCSIALTEHFAWREGMVVPIGPKGYRRSIVSIKGAREPLAATERTVLTTAAIVFFERMRLLRPAVSDEDWRQAATLTGREKGCLAHVAAGLNDDEIGERLGIGATTAHWHVNNARAKLGARTRAQAVAVGLKHRLIAM